MDVMAFYYGMCFQKELRNVIDKATMDYYMRPDQPIFRAVQL
jgi:hypothetical protein